MPIEMLTGTTGGGKSYYACNILIPQYIKKGRAVVTNLPLKLDWWQEHYPDCYELIRLVEKSAKPMAECAAGREISDYESGEYLGATYGDVHLVDDYESGSRPILIIDEAAGIWSKKRTTDEDRDFIDHHRHFELDLFFIVQDERKLDPAVKYNVGKTHKVINLVQQGKSGLGAKCVLKSWDGSSSNTKKTPDYDPSTFTFKQSGYEAYQSRMFGGNMPNEKSPTSKNIWLDWRIILMGVLVTSAVVSIFYFDALRIFTGPKVSDVKAVARQQNIISARPTSSNGIVFAGSIKKGSESIFLIQLNGRAARRVTDGNLLRLGIRLRPSNGCSAWRLVKGEEPEFIQCGDELK